MTKVRLSVSVDADLAEAGRRSVAAGSAESLSAWVTEALQRQVDHDRRMRALTGFIEEYEHTHGEISAQEMEDAHRALRSRAIVVRGSARRRTA